MLNGLAALIAAVGGLVTAMTGLIGMLIVARRTSDRERGDAAQSATRQALAPPSRQDDEANALVEIKQARNRRRRRRRG